MAALAYLLPPLTGLLAYSLGSDRRVRFHGLQAVAFGFLWPVTIYGGSLAGPIGTRVTFTLGALIWIGLLVATALGRDPLLPGGRRLRSLSRG
jgi:uncharacterized membrane protein